jgi:hypothetical protein
MNSIDYLLYDTYSDYATASLRKLSIDYLLYDTYSDYVTASLRKLC